MDKGTYCLIFQNPACTVRVGALGEITFAAGFHTYVGSALGPGGLKRLDRHIAFARNNDRNPKWHVDYLLSNPRFRLASVVYAVSAQRWECRIAAALGRGGVEGFGCSDCRCCSHLFHSYPNPRDAVSGIFHQLGLAARIKTIMRNETKENL